MCVYVCMRVYFAKTTFIEIKAFDNEFVFEQKIIMMMKKKKCVCMRACVCVRA